MKMSYYAAIANWSKIKVNRTETIILISFFSTTKLFWYLKVAFTNTLSLNFISDNYIKNWYIKFPLQISRKRWKVCLFALNM